MSISLGIEDGEIFPFDQETKVWVMESLVESIKAISRMKNVDMYFNKVIEK